MANVSGQAAGMAVGAAVGSLFGPLGTAAGASIGSGAAGYFQQSSANKTQGQLDEAALNLNMEQARLKASEQSSTLARNFRKALASQVAVASMRGGSGSLAAQFGRESYQNYLEDKSAIDAGLAVSEAQGKLSGAQIEADKQTRDLKALSNFTSTAFSGVNFSNLLNKGS